jgi:hypothetical protein
MNGMLITIKVEEKISMIKNMVVSFIEEEDCRNKSIHAFKIINVEWVPKGMILRRLKILEAIMMVVNCFLKHGIPFQYDPNIRMPE